MAFNQRLFFLFLLWTIFSCSTKHQKTEINIPVTEHSQANERPRAGIIISSVNCSTDGSQSYALYLPKNYSDSIKFPVIIFFDPHGSGSYPVSMYKSLADEYGYVLMGSNNSKNGLQFEQTGEIVNSLINEASSVYAVDKKRISLAGFSGGSKVALVSAANHPELLSVIFCGAAIPFDNVRQLPPALGFAGVRDMNFTDVISSGTLLESKKIVHCIIEWEGKHEWPDTASFEDAFYWNSFAAMRNKTIAVDHALVKSFIQKRNKYGTAKQSVLEEYNRDNRLLVFLQGLTDINSYQNKLASLMQSGTYRRAIQEKQSMLQTEENLKENYGKCFGTKDLNWWKEEVERMRSMKSTGQEKMYQRLLGYLSLACYSYSNNAIKQNDFLSARQYLAIYKVADPENSEQSFLTACLFARQGEQGKAITALKEALQLGLRDKRKIETEESFNNLHTNPEFNNLLNGL
jgi:predicted esterase